MFLRHVPFALGMVSGCPGCLYQPKKSEQQQGGIGGQWRKAGTKAGSLLCLSACGGLQMLVPSVSGYMLFEGRQLIMFSGHELDQLRGRRAALQIHLLLPQGEKLCSASLNLQKYFFSANTRFF